MDQVLSAFVCAVMLFVQVEVTGDEGRDPEKKNTEWEKEHVIVYGAEMTVHITCSFPRSVVSHG